MPVKDEEETTRTGARARNGVQDASARVGKSEGQETQETQEHLQQLSQSILRLQFLDPDPSTRSASFSTTLTVCTMYLARYVCA